MFTHIQAIDLFKQFAQKHLQVRSMGVGNLPEREAQSLLLYYDPANPNKIIYPLVWVNPLPSEINEKETRIKYLVSITDMVNDDSNNLQEVLSDTLQIHHDLYAMLQDPALRDNYILDTSLTLTPGIEVGDDAAAGWDAEYTFRIYGLRDRCAAVMSSSLTIPEVTTVYT